MPEALTFASRGFTFPDTDSDLLIADTGGASAALLEAVRRRRRGVAFDVFADIPEPRAALAALLAPHLIATIADPDEAEMAFAALASGTLSVDGRAQQTMSAIDPGALETLAIVCRLADRVVVRSRAEHERLSQAFGRRVDRVRLALPDSSVPAFESVASPTAVVLWAPARTDASLEHLRFALRAVRFPILTISSESAADAGEVLRHARVVLLADSCGPEDAIACADRGVAVAAATTCGAEEYLDDVLVYEAWNSRSILAAVLAGFGAPGTRRSRRLTPPSIVRAHPAPHRGALVSLVVRTYDRPQLLRTALASASAQRYPSLEIIVVNDAGEDVRAIVESFPRTRYAVHDRQRGPNAAANTGVRLAQGKYVGLLDDDDALFPDHVERIVSALEASGAHVGHSDALAWYLTALADGTYAATGFKLFLDRAVIPSELYHTCGVLPLTVLARRSALAAVGGYPEDIPLMGDWDTFMRLAQRYDFVHVPHVTALYSIRDDASNLTADPSGRFTHSFNLIRERNSVVHRPLIHKLQLEMMGNREIAGKPVWPQPGLRIDPVATADLL